MVRSGQVLKELLLELAQTERKTIPPFQVDKVQRVQQEIREHNDEMTRLISSAESKTREAQGLPPDAPIEMLPWSNFPQDYTAMITHMSCIEHYKRGLLAYVMERVDRLKHLHWHKHRLPKEVVANLAPFEIDFVQKYELNLKKYAQAASLGLDLTMDAAPPKDRCVQVRVIQDHGDMMSKEGKVVLKKDTVHTLPLDEVEHLIRAGIVQYLHAGMTM
eukprot:TRINITY_DN2219_c1_g1_i2.p2 TRINITY_DN2219_c1_g1~~TRINITY_DN2219_c1_g1_i2.p2  ORF type:complete len:218 (+),score=16.57 TRINITY_DN2219_c1_g1_i2:132-785(+)